MSEQKYYVRLKSPNNHLGIWWCGDRSEWKPYSLEPVYGKELGVFRVIGWKVPKYIPSFTKSELAEIMDGALYRPDTSDPVFDHDLDFFDNLEWINPLVKLIPVEELKKYG